ncbi:MAG: hypothetical protein AAGF35_00540, partial [Pseudomonadota bacterium]
QQRLDALSKQLQATRDATLEAERWLAANYRARLVKTKADLTFQAQISHVNSSGFSVRLQDSGLDGLVDLRKDPEKFSYDKWTASLTSTTRRFQLHQSVEIRFKGADASAGYRAVFALTDGCGLKPAKAMPLTPAGDTAAAASPDVHVQNDKETTEIAEHTPRDGKSESD